MKKLLIGIIVYVSMTAGICVAGEPVTVAGSNTDPTPQVAGKMPYEMADRKEDRTPFVIFEDCTLWQVINKGVTASLYRSRDQRMFDHDSAKLVYLSTDPNSEMLLKPVTPVVIPEPWDSVNFWVYGNSWQYGPSVGPLDLELIIRGADQKEWSESVKSYYKNTINFKYWWLLHVKVRDNIARPATLVGIRLSGKKITFPGKEETIYFGPMYAYKEVLKPLTFKAFPENLPFPDRRETILPTNSTISFRNSIKQKGSEYVFSYKGKDGELSYIVNPAEHSFSGIKVLYKGKEMSPCADGGPLAAASPSDAGLVKWQSLGSNLKDDTLTVKWMIKTPSASKNIEYRFKIKQKSLIVELEEDASSAGIISDVTLGKAAGISNPKLSRVPMLNFDYAEAPRILYADGLFFFTQFDWYYSQASLFYAKEFPVTDHTAVYNGGARYTPKTDGLRNPVRERLFINVSPDVQEVLPTIANPKSPMQPIMGDKAWMTINCVGMTHEDRLKIPRKFRALGIENVAVRYHEGTWRDGGESFTFRTDASPNQGGNDALRNMITLVKSLGWMCGLYTNYTDFSVPNPGWNEDWLRLDENGDWNSSWFSCYSVKPMVAWQEQMKYASEVHHLYGTNHVYCDVHTAVPPFARVDYDARVPGAATFRRSFEAYGLILMNERKAHKGPVYSEGANHWWYAGLVDGNYANAFPSLIEQPFFPDFDLLKIHPLQMDAGSLGENARYMAYTLAYGHICQLSPYSDLDSMQRYYLIQPIQQYYAMVPVHAIRYWNGDKFVNSSEAIAKDANLQRKIYVEYSNGFKVWVNAGTTEWNISTDRGLVTLPANGYFAVSPDKQSVSFSVKISAAGDRSKKVPVDFAAGQVSRYIDTKNEFVVLDMMAGRGAAAMKREHSGWELIPALDFVEMGFRASGLGYGDNNIDVDGIEENGMAGFAPNLRWSRGLVWVIPGQKKCFKYRIVPTVGQRQGEVECAKYVVEGGEKVVLTLPAGAAIEAKGMRWVADGKETEAAAQVPVGNKVTVEVPSMECKDEHVWLKMPTKGGELWIDFYYAKKM